MGRSAAVMLGVGLEALAAGFAGVSWFTSGIEGMRVSAVGAGVLWAFSAAGALACLAPASRPVTPRLVCGAVFLACLAYLADMVIPGPIRGESRADPSLVKPIPGREPPPGEARHVRDAGVGDFVRSIEQRQVIRRAAPQRFSRGGATGPASRS
jgi:hypothetical protein